MVCKGLSEQRLLDDWHTTQPFPWKSFDIVSGAYNVSQLSRTRITRLQRTAKTLVGRAGIQDTVHRSLHYLNGSQWAYTSPDYTKEREFNKTKRKISRVLEMTGSKFQVLFDLDS